MHGFFAALSDDFTPLSLLPKLKMWFDASLASSLVIATGYSSWTDRVGGYVLTQGVPAEQPTPRIIAGDNFVQFTAAAGQSLSSVVAVSGVLGVPGAFEVVTASQFDSFTAAANFGAPGIFRTSGSNRISHSVGTAGVYGSLLTNAAGGLVGTANAPVAGVTYRTRERYDGTAIIRAQLGAGVEAAAGATNAQDPTNYAFGAYMGGVLGAPFLDGAVRHVFVCVPELTASERAQLDAWLAADCAAVI